MKLEVGMYCRTLNEIVKIAEIKDGVMIDTKGHLHFGDYIKASFNIIDILEVKDIIEIDVIDEDNYPSILGNHLTRIEDKIELACIIDMIRNNSARLVRILTHQQFEQMSYKLGE